LIAILVIVLLWFFGCLTLGSFFDGGQTLLTVIGVRVVMGLFSRATRATGPEQSGPFFFHRSKS
jgi:hypothetical protein